MFGAESRGQANAIPTSGIAQRRPDGDSSAPELASPALPQLLAAQFGTGCRDPRRHRSTDSARLRAACSRRSASRAATIAHRLACVAARTAALMKRSLLVAMVNALLRFSG